MATAKQPRFRTLEEFLAWEDRQPLRHELVGGVVHMMTGGTLGHARITGNIAADLTRRVAERDFEALANDMRVVSPRGDVMYPDVVVVRSHLPGTATEIRDPVVVVEVLSDSTAGRDHCVKR